MPLPASPARLRSGLRILWIGPLCLITGIVLGRTLLQPASPPPVWRGPELAAAPTERRGSVRQPGFADVVDRSRGGVVTVYSMFAPDDAPPVDDASMSGGSGGVRRGSGFVVSPEGLVVTARHLVWNSSRVFLDVLEHERLDAMVVGEDVVTDLAVLRLASPPPRLQVLELGRSEDVRAGDWIVAVGNPLGFTHTVTAGIVSYVGRHLRQSDLRVSSDFLQFSAAVNPGSSGCPVLDLDGRVVGVTTQAAGDAQGISFAIPSRTLKWVLDECNNNPSGRVQRGYLGIEFESRPGVDDYGKPLEGACVRRIAKGQPADRAGLQQGDVVLFMDDQRVVDSGDLHERITRSRPGRRAQLTILRDGRLVAPIEVELGQAVPPRDDIFP